MKTAYAPDNTRSSIVILVALAVIVSVIAAVIGLSDKPDVATIAISPNDESPLAAALSTANFGFDPALDGEDANADDPSASPMLDETGEPFDDAEAASSEAERTPEGEVIVVPASLPTPTPEVAAAVEPTPAADLSDTAAEAAGAVQAAPSLPTTSGTVQGTFFTKGDENEGAVVSQNVITVSFAEDGSGAFQGVLDITYVDGTHILLNMSGPLTWAPTNPQVEATLAGAFTLDAPIDTDDVTSEDADLSISSLAAGSGSLCTTKCFGFTFPPQ